MFSFFKNIIKKTIAIIASTFSRTRLGRLISETVIKDVMRNERSVIHNNIHLTFTVPNQLNHFRIDTFSTKEPETLEWIDSFPDNSILWDIGANVGLYSTYAAKAKNCNVVAFEPSVFNLELLARNIFLNNLNKQIIIFPLPLTSKLGPNRMSLTTMEWGGALSSFGENYGWDGNRINDIFSFSTYGCNMDKIAKVFKLPQPDYIKIDVDGIEHIILEGGINIVSEIKGMLIEINDDFKDQSDRAKSILEEAGLVFEKKLHGKIFDQSATSFANTYNQIWMRK